MSKSTHSYVTETTKHQRHRALVLGMLLAVSVMLLGAGIYLAAEYGLSWYSAHRAADFASSVPGPGRENILATLPQTKPVSLSIPSQQISASIVPVGLLPDGTLEVPHDENAVGWYAYSPVPGSPGPSVMTGHLDSTTGPAVFWHLNRIRTGDTIMVTSSDGATAQFTVDAVETYRQDNFPTQSVYGTTGVPSLRLITCAGTYLRSRAQYSDNLVVYASLVSVKPQAK